MTATITKPGIFVDFDEAAYFADPCPKPSLTQSIAKVLIDRSPAHACVEHPRLSIAAEADEAPEKYIAAQAIGNAAHKLLLGRGRDVVVVNADAWRSDAAKKTRAEAEAAGKLPILAKHNDRAVAMVAAVRERIDAAGCPEAFRDGAGEVVVAATDQYGFWHRSLIDWVCSTTMLYDVKTTGKSAAPHVAGTNLADAGWDIQAAMQEFILDQIDPENAGRRKFRFVQIENAAPFALTVCELTESVMTMGRKKLAYAMPLWRKCLATKDWPAYPAEIIRPEYPGWKESQWLAREDEQAERETRRPETFNPNIIMAG